MIQLFPLTAPAHWLAPLRAGLCGVLVAQTAMALAPLPARSQPQSFPIPGDSTTSPGPLPEDRPRTRPETPPASLARRFPDNPQNDGFRYRLAPGDRVRVSVFKVEGYEAETEVLSDGTVNLPRIGSVNVWGLTLDEANKRITRLYSRILRRPLVYIDLLTPRPVRVTMVGQVERPGFYTLTRDPSTSTLRPSGPSPEGVAVTTSGWPTMVDAIQRAGGITALGDLSNLVLVRRGHTPSDPPREYHFDYLKVLMENGTAVNPLIYDGDTIRVSKVKGPRSSDALIASSTSNFAPDSIAVNVVGEVVSPGLKQVKSNTPLTNAVLAAGGLDPQRANTTNLRLLRLESDGTIVSKEVAYDPAAPLGSEQNPPLRNGDVIVVARNAWTRANDLLVQAVTPLGPLLNAASLYNILAR
ncbi:polysaccharide biosynthesis/export family protein [Cyanobium sp. NIES-981]|uniref:polysaccharide biosynthesis/export family protein n=1 Tax=Cyanobium sp. NIES-981 TaxID=1851505 RepID=UPI0007DDD9DA|nr:polysaccharide biosynthesis/export family protein [Cyanobium sp. NIES-981]SBO44586.1 Polysaccharide export outer membrane protein [Cyanobium sp. NIES-981]